jgi:hypothetical protein
MNRRFLSFFVHSKKGHANSKAKESGDESHGLEESGMNAKGGSE